MPSNTPNLELYMKNPTTDGSDYFDVETMMNDNWEKIDDFAGVMDTVKERLDTISRSDVTLQPGLQVIEVSKTAPFSLEYLTGRMLVNLLGRYGGCEVLGPWEGNIALITDATKRTSGLSSFRLTIGSTTATASITFNTRPGLRYIFAADVEVPNGVSGSIGVVSAPNSASTTGGASWKPLAHSFVATEFFHQLRLTFSGPSGSVCWMDSVRIYEVSEADYIALASMTIAERAAKYPYVDSVKPVRNPYAIRWTDANRTDIAAMLALQTDLYADPLTGDNADSVYERDGQYFKTTQWIRRESFTQWDFLPSTDITIPNGRRVYTTGLPVPARQSAPGQVVTKYTGQILTFNGSANTLDSYYVNTSGTFYLVIPAVDSGWGADYAPSTDEIRAYFMGWRMNNGVFGAPYNGSGTKTWARLDATNNTGAATSIPTTMASGYAPYELIYQLATPTVDPILSEGQLTLNEGNNQIEVGSGIVLRERANPLGNTLFNGFYINNLNQFPGSSLAHRAQKIMSVYKNSKRDVWTIVLGNAYGLEQAFKRYADYDTAGAYSVTYLMLDTSPVAAFIGSVPDNEKSLLADLVQDVQQASTRLSVVESKKAEKDSPAWIAPTLLNGFVGVDVAYRLMGDYVELKGLITAPGTSVAADTFVFRLPPGYRALQTKRLSTTTFNSTTDFAVMAVNAGVTGDVSIAYTGKKYITLDGLRIPMS